MKCPYCQQEMRSGFLHNGTQPVQWIPEGGKPSNWKWRAAKGGIQLSKGNGFWNGYTAEAHYCPSCGIVITKTK